MMVTRREVMCGIVTAFLVAHGRPSYPAGRIEIAPIENWMRHTVNGRGVRHVNE